MNKIIKLFAVSALALFAACSDYAGDIEDDYNKKLAAGKIECDRDIEGLEVSTVDGGDRVCRSGEWVTSSSSMADAKSSGSKYSSSSGKSSSGESTSSSGKSSSGVSSSSSAVTELYKCANGEYAINEENCDRVNCASISGTTICKDELVDSLGECTTEILDSIGFIKGVHLICEEDGWNKAGNLDVDTYRWDDGKDGDSRYGSFNTALCYVYDTSSTYAGWRRGESNDCSLDIGGCTLGRAGEVHKMSSGNFYSCIPNKWTPVSKDIAEDTWGEKCDVDGKTMYGKVHTSDLFVCEDYLWREAELLEYNNGPCTKKLEGIFTEDKSKYCSATGWKTASDLDKAVGKICNDENRNKFATTSNKDTTLVCAEYGWRLASCAEREARAVCDASVAASDSNTVVCPDDGNSYICEENAWRLMEFYDYDHSSTNFLNPDITYGTLTDERDNQTYKVLSIRTSSYEADWMAENLNYADSTSNPYLKENSWCYDNDENNCKYMGRLYTWTAMVSINQKLNPNYNEVHHLYESLPDGMIKEEHQGVCPSGWHVPSGQEWIYLYSTFDNDYYAMASKAAFKEATNASGFSLLPGEYFYSNFSYDDTYTRTFESYGRNQWAKEGYVILSSRVETWDNYQGDGQNYWDGDNPINGRYVRCVKNCSTCKKPDGDLVDARDNHTYKTVVIGNKIWMAENLNYAYMQPTSGLDSSSFCYNNESANCDTYGRLYLWNAAMDACPEGWHLPSESEMDKLIMAEMNAYSRLQYNPEACFEATFKNTKGVGFSGVPAGYRDENGVYSSLSTVITLWTSSSDTVSLYVSNDRTCTADVNYTMTTADFINAVKKTTTDTGVARSVRCVKD